jgi:hypothetical protein
LSTFEIVSPTSLPVPSQQMTMFLGISCRSRPEPRRWIIPQRAVPNFDDAPAPLLR